MEIKTIFYCQNIFTSPQTGGEYFYANILTYLKKYYSDACILPNKVDLYNLNRKKNALKINLYFIRRFICLPQNTMILEGESFYYALFLANSLVRLIRNDIKIVIFFEQMPNPLTKRKNILLKRNLLMYFFLHSAHVIFANSKYVKNVICSIFHLSQQKVSIIYPSGNTVSVAMDEAIIKCKENTRINILCVAHIRVLKGQLYLIKALAEIKNESWKCFLVGGIKEPEYLDEIKRLISVYGLSERIIICGKMERENLASMYKNADIFVLPSLYEAYGVVIHEALSFGLPIVASNEGGIPEQVTDGIEGFLVPPKDVKALTTALKNLIINEALRSQFSKNALERVKTMQSWDMIFNCFKEGMGNLK